VLDAGCGNGMLAYQSYLRGNRVLGISIKPGEIERNRRLFHQYLGVPEQRLEFLVHNLYDIHSLGRQFHEIVCTEVLEHIVDDRRVCESFYRLLRPGGTLHLCCPNADHPDHRRHCLDERECGGHVRPGYTERTYRELLEPIGFEVGAPIGLGGPIRQACNRWITAAQETGGLALGLAAFASLALLPALDSDTPATPYSLYVRARRPT
jgi:SAM-dependent methyltransferase